MSSEELEAYKANGIIRWGDPIERVLDEGRLVIEQTQRSVRTPLVTMLISGEFSVKYFQYGWRAIMCLNLEYIYHYSGTILM